MAIYSPHNLFIQKEQSRNHDLSTADKVRFGIEDNKGAYK